MNDIKFHCPECGGHLVVDEKGVDLTVRCPHCSKSIIIPAQDGQGEKITQKKNGEKITDTRLEI